MQARRRNDGGSDDWLKDDDAMSARVRNFMGLGSQQRCTLEYTYGKIKMGSSN